MIQQQHGATKEAQQNAKIDRENKHQEMIYEIEGLKNVVRELSNATIEGSPELVEKLPDNSQEWDFKVGQISFWLKEEALFKSKPLLLLIRSKDKKKIIKIYKDGSDFIKCMYRSPEIGTILRGAKLRKTDCSGKGPFGCVYIVFQWNLQKQKTTLYINAKPRDDIY